MSDEFSCPLCHRSFSHCQARLDHLQICATLSLALPHREAPPEPRVRRRIFSCKKCDEVFISQRSLDDHRQQCCPIAEPILFDRYRRSPVDCNTNCSSGSGDP